MSDTVGLAGTIGTWVAVFLAIVALAGVLPAWFLYKKSKTARVQELALVDDPDHTFISSGIRFPGFRLNQKIKFPDLLNPPRLRNLPTRPDAGKLGSRRSTTNWVNFANVTLATFPSIKLVPESNFAPAIGFGINLPVHRSWILILGVLHRYAIRRDYGLPLGATTDEEMEAMGYTNVLSGLSGILFRSGNNPISYEMHSLPQLQHSLRQEPIDTQALILLFLGYIQMPNEKYFSSQFIPKRFASRARGRNKEFADRLSILSIVDSDIPRSHVRPIQELRLSITTFKCLDLVRPHSLFESDLTPTLNAEILEQRGYSNVGTWKSHGENRLVWMARKDIHKIVSTYFGLQLSAKGVLYDATNDIIVRRVFKTNDISKTLELAKSWLSQLDVNDTQKQMLQVALDAVTKADLEEVSWSRHAMQTFHGLDEAIKRVLETDNWKFASIRVLYACNEDFKLHMRACLEMVQEHLHLTVKFDIIKKSIKLPKENSPHDKDYDIDFQHTFPSMNATEGNMNMPFAQAAFSSLQGHLRAIMWKMSLSPKGLMKFYENLPIVPLVGYGTSSASDDESSTEDDSIFESTVDSRFDSEISRIRRVRQELHDLGRAGPPASPPRDADGPGPTNSGIVVVPRPRRPWHSHRSPGVFGQPPIPPPLHPENFPQHYDRRVDVAPPRAAARITDQRLRSRLEFGQAGVNFKNETEGYSTRRRKSIG